MRKALTIIEVVVTIAIIALISAITFVAFNPAGQLASSRNRDRQLNLQAIMNGIRLNIADQNKGGFSILCSGVSTLVPTSTKRLSSASSGFNIAPCLVPNYLDTMPFDPSTSSAHYTSNADYDTGYTISINSSTGQITLKAPAAELSSTISVVR